MNRLLKIKLFLNPSQDSNFDHQNSSRDSSQDPRQDTTDPSKNINQDPTQVSDQSPSHSSNLYHNSKEESVSKKVRWKKVLSETNDGTPFIPQHMMEATALTVDSESKIADNHPMKTGTIVE